MFRSRLRCAAGGCVLAAGLLMGGGAVAVADPGLGGSAPNGDDGTNAPVQSGLTAGSPVGNVTDTVRETIQGVTGTSGSGAQPAQQRATGPTSTLGSGRQPGQQPSTGATSPKTKAGGTNTEDQKEDAGLVPAVPNPVAAGPNVVAPATNLVPPVTEVVAPATDVHRGVVAPVTEVVPQVTEVVAPVTNVVTPITGVVAPVTDALAPVSDVIAPGQDLLASVAGAVVPLTQPPCDLSSFLLGIAGVAPAGDGSGGIHGPGLSAAAGTTGESPARIPGVPLAGNATPVGTLDVIALSRASALSGMAPLAPDRATPIGVPSQSFFQQLCELLLIASLWALAAAALPGIGGLLTLTAAGVRVGYRQAKAGFAVRPAGIARFAPPARLSNVVRSGSSVGVRPRALRVVHPGALTARRLPD